MVNRVVLDAGGLKVSRPGFNVLTAGDQSLQFSSLWSQLSLHMKGSVSVSANSTPYELLFGKTFANRPLCFFLFDNLQITNGGVGRWGLSGGVWLPLSGVMLAADRAYLYRGSFSGIVRYVIWDMDL